MLGECKNMLRDTLFIPKLIIYLTTLTFVNV
jgi:hypothetical protein